MKIQIVMKTPDCLYHVTDGMDEDVKYEFLELCEKWFKYGECVTLEVDTKLRRCVVLEN